MVRFVIICIREAHNTDSTVQVVAHYFLVYFRCSCAPASLSYFHCIGLGNEDFGWLKKMAAAVPNGKVHEVHK